MARRELASPSRSAQARRAHRRPLPELYIPDDSQTPSAPALAAPLPARSPSPSAAARSWEPWDRNRDSKNRDSHIPHTPAQISGSPGDDDGGNSASPARR